MLSNTLSLRQLFARLPPSCRARSVGRILEDTSLMPTVAIILGLLYEGRFTLMVAREKLGKTTFLWFLASVLAAGGEIFGARVRRRKVLVFSLEEAEGDTKSRAQALGNPALDRVHVVSRLRHPTLSPLHVLRANIAHLKPDVVIIDTLAAYSSGRIGSENDASAWNAVLLPLQEIAHTQNISVLLFHHAAKRGAGARGSTAISAIPDHLVDMTAAENLGSNVRCLNFRGRYSSGQMHIAFDDHRKSFHLADVGPMPRESAKPRGRAASDEQVSAAILSVVEAAGDVGAASGEIRKAAGVQGVRTDAILKALVEEGVVRKQRQGPAIRYAMANG